MMGAELMVEFAKLAPGQRCRSVDDDIRINTVVLNKKKGILIAVTFLWQ